jgi:hypothetical protein
MSSAEGIKGWTSGMTGDSARKGENEGVKNIPNKPIQGFYRL